VSRCPECRAEIRYTLEVPDGADLRKPYLLLMSCCGFPEGAPHGSGCSAVKKKATARRRA
jgi:hypothetical protein